MQNYAPSYMKYIYPILCIVLKIKFSGTWRRVVWYKFTDASGKPDATLLTAIENSTFKIEAVGSYETSWIFASLQGVTS
jgi:hypothetical protein